jgi:hypothetical protein
MALQASFYQNDFRDFTQPLPNCRALKTYIQWLVHPLLFTLLSTATWVVFTDLLTPALERHLIDFEAL